MDFLREAGMSGRQIAAGRAPAGVSLTPVSGWRGADGRGNVVVELAWKALNAGVGIRSCGRGPRAWSMGHALARSASIAVIGTRRRAPTRTELSLPLLMAR